MEKNTQDFRLSSPAFADSQIVSKRFTCQGAEVSPELVWENPPQGTKSFFLQMVDLDIPLAWLHRIKLTHWLVYNIPVDCTRLAEDLPKEPSLADGLLQGVNSMRRTGYMGPCPPFGTHRYVFTISALDRLLNLDPRQAGPKQLKNAVKGHILAQANLTGLYARNSGKE